MNLKAWGRFWQADQDERKNSGPSEYHMQYPQGSLDLFRRIPTPSPLRLSSLLFLSLLDSQLTSLPFPAEFCSEDLTSYTQFSKCSPGIPAGPRDPFRTFLKPKLLIIMLCHYLPFSSSSSYEYTMQCSRLNAEADIPFKPNIKQRFANI